MANKYSRSNSGKNGKKTMADYEKDRSRLNKTAKIMAIIMALIMVIFAIVSTAAFLM